MKKTHSFRLVAVIAFAAVISQSQAQLGDISKGLTVNVTAASLNADLFGGLDFFAKANEHFATAMMPAKEAQEMITRLKSENQDDRRQAVKDSTPLIEQAAKEAKAKGEALSAQATEEIRNGQKEIGKGTAKWTAVGVSLGVVAKKGDGDAALLAAIPVAQEMLKDLPDLKRMNDTLKELKPLMKK